MKLAEKKCKPCEGGIPPLTKEEVAILQKDLHHDWRVENEKRILRDFRFVNFKQAIHFVNRVAELAESEGHHPDIKVGYGYCSIQLWTHAIKGLSENDFILAAKIDAFLAHESI